MVHPYLRPPCRPLPDRYTPPGRASQAAVDAVQAVQEVAEAVVKEQMKVHKVNMTDVEDILPTVVDPRQITIPAQSARSYCRGTRSRAVAVERVASLTICKLKHLSPSCKGRTPPVRAVQVCR